MTNVLTTLVENQVGRFQRFVDGCACGRTDKAAVAAIKKELEMKDSAIERLEEEIRRKDSEKDNLIHMQKDLQAQIEEIRRLLEANANESLKGYTQDTPRTREAALLMQNRARGIHARNRVQHIREKKAAAVKLQSIQRSKFAKGTVDKKRSQEKTAQMIQARARGKSTRKLIEQKKARQHELGILGRGSLAADGSKASPAVAIGRAIRDGEDDQGVEALDDLPLRDDDESVDSDYDYNDDEFRELGQELMQGRLKLAKVYGQEEPPAAEDQLEWETRYFVLYDERKMVHYDDMQDGLPFGDRGLIDLVEIKSVEKVLGVNTFVMKGDKKVYLLKLEPHDEVTMRTWIGAISVELHR